MYFGLTSLPRYEDISFLLDLVEKDPVPAIRHATVRSLKL